MEDVKRKFASKSGWGKMKIGADVANAILSGYPLLQVPVVGQQSQPQEDQVKTETPVKKRVKLDDAE